jgi:hypothetical protein
MKIPKLLMFQPVEVVWEDVVGDRSGWCLKDEFSFAEHELSLYHKTIGYFMGTSKECLYLCMSKRELDGMCGGRMSFPFGCLKKIRKL